jgi:ADP-ribose pyrophosphatase
MSSNKKNWIKVKTEVAYENPWIKVEHHDVINPSGGEGIYGQVNFKNIATGIIPLDKDGFTWLIGQHRFPLDEYSWEIPEGGCPFTEDVLVAAKRELQEEAGILAKKWMMISKIHTSNSVCNEVGFIFLAEDLEFTEAKPEETEDLQVKKVHIKDAIKMVMENKITDSISVAGLLKVGVLKKLF